MPKVKVNDIEMYYEVYDFSKPWLGRLPLILIHGYCSAMWFFRFNIPEFAKEFKTIAVDMRGHGGSDVPKTKWTVRTMSDDLNDFMNVLEIEKAYIHGISMGGMIAQQLAIDHPDKVAALVLGVTQSEPLPPPLDFESGKQVLATWTMEDFNTHILEAQAGEWFDKDLLEWCKEQVRKTSNYTFGVGYETGSCESVFTFSVTGQLEKIKVPTLILCGKDDTVCPCTFAEILNKNIANSKLVKLPGKHVTFIEHPEPWNKEIIEFLSGL